MARRKPLTEAVLLHIIRSQGRFCLNPLSTRNTGLMKTLERMRKDGMLTRRNFKLSYAEYYLPPNKGTSHEAHRTAGPAGPRIDAGTGR